MRTFRAIATVSLLVLIISACSKLVDFNSEIPDPRLVLYASLQQDSSVKAHLSHSIYILDDTTQDANICSRTIHKPSKRIQP